jgi:ankyrin repeat protein
MLKLLYALKFIDPSPIGTLIKASIEGYYDIIKYLTNTDIDINDTVHDKFTAIEGAVKYGYSKIFKHLLRLGPSHQSVRRAFKESCQRNRVDMFYILYRKYKFIPLTDDIRTIIKGKHDKLLELIFKLSIYVSPDEKYLDDAVTLKSTRMVELLLNYNIHNGQLNNALVSAVKQDNIQITKMLLNAGANPFYQGDELSNMAKRNGNQEMVELLYSARYESIPTILTPMINNIARWSNRFIYGGSLDD